MKLLKSLFCNLLDCEHAIEEIRIAYSKNKSTKFRELFNVIDLDQDGYVSPQEVNFFFFISIIWKRAALRQHRALITVETRKYI